ncbi:hypothetical protein NE237_032719 [Protea cynaroides]|uniref:Uncharacterized protein n=1 Tax=Protea cynaroides TaxID=273540 RepID=A0A9Q0R3R2_9MAGN|nr:hypothetical protein NE237_032719 [Protea cynaroides]
MKHITAFGLVLLSSSVSSPEHISVLALLPGVNYCGTKAIPNASFVLYLWFSCSSSSSVHLRVIPREARDYELGETKYYFVVVFSAIIGSSSWEQLVSSFMVLHYSLLS